LSSTCFELASSSNGSRYRLKPAQARRCRLEAMPDDASKEAIERVDAGSTSCTNNEIEHRRNARKHQPFTPPQTIVPYATISLRVAREGFAS
jgi:hypothetical protein